MSRLGQSQDDNGVVEQRQILDFFISANNSLIKGKMQKYQIITDSGLSRRCSSWVYHKPTAYTLFDVIPVYTSKTPSPLKPRGKLVRKS
jgi:hypothetical protein